MKTAIIFILAGLVIFLGLSVFRLTKELLSAKRIAAEAQVRNDELQRELIRLSKVNSENEKFLKELEQSIGAFETKLPFSSLQKYIPKRILDDVKPIIERLESFQKQREDAAVSNEELRPVR